MRTLLFILISVQCTLAQKYKLDKSLVSFFSSAPIEDIRAGNTKSNSIFNLANGEIVISIPINQFQFDKALMQQHFNEKYMESGKYPRATFQGKISGIEKVQYQQEVLAIGIMNIHGVNQAIEIPGQLTLNKDQIDMKAVFKVILDDYKIKIPAIMWKNIAEEIEVTVNFIYKPYEN
jgi:hypothetical protein